MWWRHPYVGNPEEVMAMARKLADHQHDGSGDGDMYWDGLLDDLRSAIAHYDKRYGNPPKPTKEPTFDWPVALRCHGGDGKGFATPTPQTVVTEVTLRNEVPGAKFEVTMPIDPAPPPEDDELVFPRPEVRPVTRPIKVLERVEAREVTLEDDAPPPDEALTLTAEELDALLMLLDVAYWDRDYHAASALAFKSRVRAMAEKVRKK